MSKSIPKFIMSICSDEEDISFCHGAFQVFGNVGRTIAVSSRARQGMQFVYEVNNSSLLCCSKQSADPLFNSANVPRSAGQLGYSDFKDSKGSGDSSDSP